MKIVHLLWSFSTGGIENMLVDIANEQIIENDVHIIIVNDMIDMHIKLKLDERIQFHSCNRPQGSKNPFYVIKLNYYLYRIHPDILHVHMGFGLSKLVFWNGIKVRTIHNTNNSSSEYKWYNRLYAISNTVNLFTQKQGYEAITIQNGIKTDDIRVKENYKRKESCIHVIQISRLLVKQKGQDLLLRAIAHCKASGCKDFKLHIVGSGEDERMLKQMAFDLGINDDVIFEGCKDRNWVYENLANFDLLIQPSYFEGFGLTVAEAMAAKVPVLVSNIEGPMEIIDNGRLGWLFKVGDFQDLADKIRFFLEGGYDYDILDKARTYIFSNYDVKNTAQKYMMDYKTLLDLDHD